MYMGFYIPCIVIACAVLPRDHAHPRVDGIPLHFPGMFLNLVSVTLTIRDLYLRPCPDANQKLTWLILILLTGGVGWLVYVSKYGIKPRTWISSSSSECRLPMVPWSEFADSRGPGNRRVEVVRQ